MFKLSILLNVLEKDFGVSGTTLKWFYALLSDCKQLVLIISAKAPDDFNLNFPQGSCMGPVLFTLYFSQLFYINSQHLPSTHCYADDTQPYFSFQPWMSLESHVEAIKVLGSCITDVQSWFIVNHLISFLLSASIISWQRLQSILSSLVNLAFIKPSEVFETLDHGLMPKCIWTYM